MPELTPLGRIIAAAAARFESRPLYRASIATRKELGVPVNREEVVEKLRNAEAGLAAAIDALEKAEVPIDSVLSDLEEVAHALEVYVGEIAIFVDGGE